MNNAPSGVMRRPSDMDDADLRVCVEEDGDVELWIVTPEHGGSPSVQFCTPMRGGGKSPYTWRALVALARAMNADNNGEEYAPREEFDNLAVLEELRSRVALAGSQAQLALDLGVSPTYICDILHGRRDISATFADLLGFKKVATYVKG